MRLSPLLFSLLLPLSFLAACGTDDDSKDDDDDDDDEETVDADEDGATADEDCDDLDANRHPDAEDLCDGLDQNCDGLDGDPATPQALLVRQGGDVEDISANMTNGVNVDIVRPAELYVCGGTWDPWLLVDAKLDIYASNAVFTSTSLNVDDADVTVQGGVWSGVLDFAGVGTGRLSDLELESATVSADDGYVLSVVGADLLSGAMYTQGGELRLEDLTIGGTEALAVNASQGGALVFTNVTITNTNDGAVVRVDNGSLTVDGLVMTDTPANISVITGEASLNNLNITGGEYPLYLAGSSVTVSNSVFTRNYGVISNTGVLVVEDTAFVETDDQPSVASSGSVTILRSSFTGTTRDVYNPYEVSFDIESLDRELLIDGCTFADSNGGSSAIFTNGPTTVTNTTFTNMGGSKVAIVGAYLATPFLSDELDGRVVFDGITIDGASSAVFIGTLCPTLRDTVVSGLEGEFARFRSWDEENIRCTQFGDGLSVDSGEGIVFETPVTLGCTDCDLTGMSGSAVVIAPSGDLTFTGGTISGNVSNGDALTLGSGSVNLLGVDLGEGASENTSYNGGRNDVLIDRMAWDGSGTVTVRCDAEGCR